GGTRRVYRPDTGAVKSRRRPLWTRKDQGDPPPFPLLRLDGHAAAVSVDDGADDGQSESRAATRPMGLPIGVEDVRQRVSGNSDAGVLDLELELRPGVDHPHDDSPARPREPDRVGAEVDDHLMEPLAIAIVGEARSKTLELEAHPGVGGPRISSSTARSTTFARSRDWRSSAMAPACRREISR